MKAPLVVGNWKMHGTQSDCVDRARSIINGLHEKPSSAEVVFAPPFTALMAWLMFGEELSKSARPCCETSVVILLFSATPKDVTSLMSPTVSSRKS